MECGKKKSPDLSRLSRHEETRFSIKMFEKRVSFIWRRHPDLNRGIADLQSAALPLGYDALSVCRLLITQPANTFFGAGNETRTRYLHLGKVALYRMSYARKWCLRSELNQRHADFQSAALPTELQRHVLINMVGTTGLEPVTPCL